MARHSSSLRWVYCAVPRPSPAHASQRRIDSSKFKAVNNRDKNFTRAKMDRRMEQLEESVARYLRQLDTADRQEPSEALKTKTSRLKEKTAKLKEQDAAYRGSQAANARHSGSTDPADRSRIPLDGDERSRLQIGRASC